MPIYSMQLSSALIPCVPHNHLTLHNVMLAVPNNNLLFTLTELSFNSSKGANFAVCVRRVCFMNA